MKILVISQFYYPDNFRINDIAEELVHQGHLVQVITGLPDYATSKIPKEYRFFKRRHEVINGVNVIRVPIIARRYGAIFRMLNYLSFVISACLYMLFCKNKDFDVIYVYELSPIFQVYPARVMKWRNKKKLVLYCCDLWPESMKSWGIKESDWIYGIIKKLSIKLYISCDTVAITSRPFREYLVDVCGVDNAKIVYLPQHCEDDYAEIAGKYEDNGVIDFLFAGNIGAVQDVGTILRAVALVQTSKRYEVHIVGDGSELEKCKALSKELGLDEKVTFHGRYPLSEMKNFYKMADCFLLTLRGGDFIGKTLPAKAQGYLSAGKPILAAIDGAGREVIAEADCGEAVPAGDVQALADKMTMLADNFDSYKVKGQNGRRFYEQHFTKQIFIDKLMYILEGNG